MYAAQPSGPLSLLARVRRLDAAAYERLEDERHAVRIGAMRTSGYLVAVEDADLVRAATARPAAAHAWRLRDAGIGDDEHRRLRAAVLAAATEPRTTAELAAAAGTDRPLAPLLQTMAFAGELVAVRPAGLRSNAARHVATEAWLGRPFADRPAAAALAWLAGRYLAAFGPARVEDFRWWAGVPADAAAAAVAEVDTVDVGDGLRLPAGDLPAFDRLRRPRRATVDLLPKWDCWTMGYPRDGRRRFVDPDAQALMYDRDGNALGVVLADGLAAATWGLRERRGRLDVDLAWLDRPGPALASAARAAVDAAAAFLGFPGRVDVRETAG
ncbi:MAG TPA: crosslink repair DNA glycosylase YcaQ family protein [Acidimicrobiales bacterium]